MRGRRRTQLLHVDLRLLEVVFLEIRLHLCDERVDLTRKVRLCSDRYDRLRIFLVPGLVPLHRNADRNEHNGSACTHYECGSTCRGADFSCVIDLGPCGCGNRRSFRKVTVGRGTVIRRSRGSLRSRRLRSYCVSSGLWRRRPSRRR